MNKCVVFDLDDTLIYEYDFLKSAFKKISFDIDPVNSKNLYLEMLNWRISSLNVFDELCSRYKFVKKDNLINTYRIHKPQLNLTDGALELLSYCKKMHFKLGLLTDGYSITQRNKLDSVCIEKYFNEIVISEEFGSNKYNIANFKFFDKFKCDKYYYIGDNVEKDFINPNKLGWTTICLMDRGYNIHKQNFELPLEYLPHFKISNLSEAINII